MKLNTKKVTFSLPVDIVEKYRDFAKTEDIPSVNSAVKSAMELYAIKIEKEKLLRAMLEAANDPLFVKDLAESMAAFEIVDFEDKVGKEL